MSARTLRGQGIRAPCPMGSGLAARTLRPSSPNVVRRRALAAVLALFAILAVLGLPAAPPVSSDTGAAYKTQNHGSRAVI